MLKILNSSEFKQLRREKLLDYSTYKKEAEDLAMRIPRTTLRLADKEWMSKKTAVEAENMTHGRAEYSADLLTLSYSAGTAIEDLRVFYSAILDHWDEFALYAKASDNSAQSEGTWVAHFALLGDAYEMVNRIACFGILLGRTELLPRLAAIIDYRNPQMDGMLERLLLPFVPGRPPPPDECTRHLPYFKTLKIFKAAKEERPSMMAEYLTEWYHASRREPYFESHTRGNFRGYWSWEAAAITFILDIDDTSYRDAIFYPGDLVEFARSNRDSAASNKSSLTAAEELRCKAGEVCPMSGKWETLSLPAEYRIFQKGDVMGDSATPYGLTVWIYKGEVQQ
jgi:hypothetical protein